MKKQVLACLAAVVTLAGGAMAQTVKSKAEYDAFMAIQNAPTPDAQIAAADKFITTYADSQLKPMVLVAAARAAQRKPDSAKAIVYAQSALEAEPKNYEAMLIIAGEQARGTRENDLDKEEKLGQAEKLANDVIKAMPGAQKPQPTIPDDRWNQYKKENVAEAHEDLGLVAMVRKKYDVAISEFQAAVENSGGTNPSTMVRLAAAYNAAGKYDDSIATVDKVLASPNLDPRVKQFAQAEKTRAEQAKNAKK